MDAYNYNSLINELCLLPSSEINSDSTIEEVELVREELLDELKEESKPEPKEEPKKVLESPVKSQLNMNNYTFFETPQLLVGKIQRAPLVMNGGSDKLNKILKLYNNPPHLSVIIKHYYNNYNKVINSKDIINILVSLIYNEFIDSEKELLSIITPEYIKTIPEMYKFNFKDKVMRDLKKACPGLASEKHICTTCAIQNKFDILDEQIANLQNSQNGGSNKKTSKKSNFDKKINKRIDTSVDKTVEEKIKNNIDILSTFLKSNKRVQKGGFVTPANILTDINTFNALPPAQKKEKVKIREMQEKSNMWVVELLEQKLATKIIKDGEYNIARYYLKNNNADPTINRIIDFLNDNATILTLKDDDRIKINMPNPLDKVLRYDNLKKTMYTDQLKEYFNKKYQELLNLRDLSSKKINESNNPLDKIKFILKDVQTGGLLLDKKCVESCKNEKELEMKLENALEEKCFTSKQLGLFLKKVGSYLRMQNKTIDNSDITLINADIQNIEAIEKNLIKNYKIFNNYKKISEVYPDMHKKEVTLRHMEDVYNTNQQLFDQYGNVNENLLNVIKKVEKYSDLKKYSEMVDMTKELNELSQSGGNFNSTKSYLNFNNEYDIEHFTSRSFRRILAEINEENNE